MSDIGLPGLERLLLVFYTICIVGPPLLIGLVFLIINRFTRRSGKGWVGLYFLLSIGTVCALMGGWSVWFNDLDAWRLAVPFGVGSSVLVFGIYRLLKRVWKKRKVE